jgi:hypothetical protein
MRKNKDEEPNHLSALEVVVKGLVLSVCGMQIPWRFSREGGA